VDKSGIKNTDVVLEIGPGTGALETVHTCAAEFVCHNSFCGQKQAAACFSFSIDTGLAWAGIRPYASWQLHKLQHRGRACSRRTCDGAIADCALAAAHAASEVAGLSSCTSCSHMESRCSRYTCDSKIVG
jgi:hypothetical protein